MRWEGLRSREGSSGLEPWMVVPVLAGLLGLTIQREPTAIGWWNTVLVCSVLVLCSIAGAIARPLAWPLVFLPAIALAASTVGLVAAIAIPLVALGALALGAPRTAIGAVLGAAAGVLLLSLERVDPIWLPTAAGFAGFGLLFLAALYSTSERGWRIGAGFAGLTFFGALLFTAVAGIGAWGLLDQVEEGSLAAERGLAAARQGETQQAEAALVDAQVALAEVDAGLSRWWMQPARLVPVVSQHLTLAQHLVNDSVRVVDAASVAAETADLGAIQIREGLVDLTALTEMAAPLTELTVSLEAAQAELETDQSIWIAEPVRRELEVLAADVATALPDAQQATLGAQVVPVLLGSEGANDYLVLFVNPSTAQPLGGQTDAIAGIRVEAGAAQLLGTPVAAPASRPWSEATSAASALESYQAATGESFDGVLVVDPAGVAALLSLSGPVNTNIGDERTFTADNVSSWLLVDQYRELADPNERDQLLGIIVGQALLEAIDLESTTQAQLLDLLGAAGRAGHIRFAASDDAAQSFIAGTFLGDRPPDPAEHNDLLAIQATGAATPQQDAYLQRRVRHDVVIDTTTGELSAALAIEITHLAPSPAIVADTEPDTEPESETETGADDEEAGETEGEVEAPQQATTSPVAPVASTQLVIETAWPLVDGGATLDGRPARVSSSEPLTSGDGFVHELTIDLSPGESTMLRLELQGSIDLADGYSLGIRRQVLARPDEMTVTVQRVDGAPLPNTGDTVFERVFDLTRHTRIDVPLA